MRDALTWGMLVVACGVVGILGYRYYEATEQISLLTQRTSRLTAELEGVTEVHKLTEAKSAEKAQEAEGTIVALRTVHDKLKTEVQSLRKALVKAGEEKDALASRLGTVESASKKLQVNVQSLETEKKQLQAKINALQADVERRQAEIERRGRALEEQKQVLRQREGELQEIKKALQADQEALRLWQETAQRLVDEQKKLKAQLDAREEDLKQATLLQAERAAEVHQLTETLKQREERIAILRKRLAELEKRQGKQPTSSTFPSMVPAGR